MTNEYTPTLEEIREVWGDRSVSREGRSTTQWRELTVAAIAEFDRAIAKIKADAIRAAGEAMEYALSFDDTYVHNSWLQDYADKLEEQV